MIHLKGLTGSLTSSSSHVPSDNSDNYIDKRDLIRLFCVSGTSQTDGQKEGHSY